MTITPTPPTPDVGLRQLWPYLREHRMALVVVGLLSMVTAGTALAQPLLVNQVISRVQQAQPVGVLSAVLVAVLVTGAVLNAVQSFLLQRTAEGLVLSTRRTLAERLLALPVVEYDQRRTGDLMSRIGADTTLLRAVVTSGLFDIVSSLLVVLGAAVAMALVDVLLLGVTLLAVMLGAVVIALASRRIRALAKLTQERVGEMTAAVERSLSAVRTIRASGATAREVTAVVAAAGTAYDVGVRTARLQALVSPAATVATQGSFPGGARAGRRAGGQWCAHRWGARLVRAVPVPAGIAPGEAGAELDAAAGRARGTGPHRGGAPAARRELG